MRTYLDAELIYNVKAQLDKRAYRSRHGTEQLELLL